MVYVQLAINLLGFGRQFLKWLNESEEREQSAKDKCEKLKKFKGVLKDANKGNTEGLEGMFSMLRKHDSELRDSSKKSMDS